MIFQGIDSGWAEKASKAASQTNIADFLKDLFISHMTRTLQSREDNIRITNKIQEKIKLFLGEKWIRFF